MSRFRVVGCDPGPIPGIVVLDFTDGQLVNANAIQCTVDIAGELVMSQAWAVTMPVLVQVETFVLGHRSSRSSTPKAGKVARELHDYLVSDLGTRVDWTGKGSRVFSRNAARVKAWATDDRLAAAELLEPTKGMTHARDAARHALFCAVHDGGIPDPISKKWSTR